MSEDKRYIATQWDIDRLEYLEDELRNNGGELRLSIAFDLRVEIQKLKRQQL